MSILFRGNQVVTVFPEEVVTDIDGNIRTRASSIGVVCRAVIQPVKVSEDSATGFESSELLRLRLVGWTGAELGAQAKVEWDGRKYSISGEPKRFNSSARTAHTDYTLTRA